jgi:hypothetical protein
MAAPGQSFRGEKDFPLIQKGDEELTDLVENQLILSG